MINERGPQPRIVLAARTRFGSSANIRASASLMMRIWTCFRVCRNASGLPWIQKFMVSAATRRGGSNRVRAPPPLGAGLGQPRMEFGEDIQLGLQGLRLIQGKAVLSPPSEGPPGPPLESGEIDFSPSQKLQRLHREVLTHHRHHAHGGEEAGTRGKVGRRTPQHLPRVAKGSRDRVEGHRSDDQDLHVVSSMRYGPRYFPTMGQSFFLVASGMAWGAVMMASFRADAQPQDRPGRILGITLRTILLAVATFLCRIAMTFSTVTSPSASCQTS